MELSKNAQNVFDLVKELTAVELASLVKSLEEEFGVTAASMVVAGGSTGDDEGGSAARVFRQKHPIETSQSPFDNRSTTNSNPQQQETKPETYQSASPRELELLSEPRTTLESSIANELLSQSDSSSSTQPSTNNLIISSTPNNSPTSLQLTPAQQKKAEDLSVKN